MNASGSNHGWDPNSLIEADLILPSQLHSASIAARTGECGLLWAVFIDGIQSYCRAVLLGSMQSLTYREVHRWIFRPDSDAITSFSNLCELFGIDPRKMRRALLHFQDHPNAELLRLLSVDAA